MVGRYSVWAVIAFLAAIVLLLARLASPPADTIIIRAPIDGFVEYVAEAGKSVPAGPNLAQERLAQAAASITAGLASLQDDLVPVETLAPPTANGISSDPDQVNLLFKLDSKVAALNLDLERWKVLIALHKLMLAEKVAAQAKELSSLEKESQNDREASQAATYAVSDFTTWHATSNAIRNQPGGAPTADQLIGLVQGRKSAADRAVETSKKFLTERIAASIANEDGRLAIARHEYVAAETALRAAEASLVLASVGCPQKPACDVVKRHAVAGQYVTKGDAIIEVRIR